MLLLLLSLIQGSPQRDDGQWTMPARDYAATRYSGLNQITPANAAHLKPVWTFSTGVLGGHEGQPLVVDRTMYVVTPYPNVLYAFDLTTEGYPLKWKYRPAVDPKAIGIACCDVINRGAAYADGKIVYNLLDGHTVAVAATTGRELWRTTIADLAQGETTPVAPFVVKNRVMVGASGGEFGIHGSLKALDLETGRIVWTAYNTGPDSEVLARAGTFKPFYDRGAELGLRSWPPDVWSSGGAPVWGWMSYDPDLDLLYYGTGNPAPYIPEQRAGDNKWTASVLARRPEDGALVWAYQFTPHDSWDFDAVAEMIVADLTIAGRRRKVLVHFDKNGFAYTLDRATGEVLVAQPFVDVNWAKRVDLVTGRPVIDSTKLTGASRGNVKHVCPTLEGGKSPASPAAYSPRTGWFYLATNNMCMDYEATQVTRIAGTPFIGANTPYHPGPGGYMGAFIAWDAALGKPVWKTTERYPVWSGALVTAGDVAFYGTLDGWFKAVDARTGALLWQFKTGSGIIGQPITYRGPDGHQYIAVLSGIGGWAGAIVSGAIDPRDSSAALGFVNAMRDLPSKTTKGGMLYVFGL